VGLVGPPPVEEATSRPVLVVAWCPDDPDRAGEVLMTPPGSTRVFGRGRAREGDPHARVVLGRQRPGGTRPTGPIELPTVSRRQLAVSSRARSIELENLGRLPLTVNGRAVDVARVTPGDVITLGAELLLYCDDRPGTLDALDAEAGHPFGAPDRFGIVGESPAAWALRQDLAFVGPRDLHTLVLGPSGTGKELAARALHALSGRAGGPFVARNAATLPEGLLDAELFGNVANYPHPGMAARPGLVGDAHRGTLFFDEIAELPPPLQAHLLRLLDDGEYHRLGEARTHRADLRVVGATNRARDALKHDVHARFPLQLRVPALTERRSDLPLLVRHLLREAAASDPDLADRFFEDSEPRVTVRFVAWVLRQDWPTNVRGLQSALWGAMIEQRHGTLDREADSAPSEVTWDLGVPAAEIPPEHVQACLDAHNGVQEEVWQALGLPNRFALRRLISRHGLVVRRSG